MTRSTHWETFILTEILSLFPPPSAPACRLRWCALPPAQGHFVETAITEFLAFCSFADPRVRCRAIQSLGMVMCRAKETPGLALAFPEAEGRTALDVYNENLAAWLSADSRPLFAGCTSRRAQPP